MRWPKKREFMVYYYLSKKFRGERQSIHQLISDVKDAFNYNTKTAKNIVKRLIKLKYLVRIDGNNIIVRSYQEVLDDYLNDFISKRKTTRPRIFPRQS